MTLDHIMPVILLYFTEFGRFVKGDNLAYCAIAGKPCERGLR